MISYCEKNQTFYLDSKNLTYAFAVADGDLEHLYFGARIAHDALGFTRCSNAHSHEAFVPGHPSENQYSRELPTFGRGDYRESMLMLRGEAGDIAGELTYTGYEILPDHRIPGMPSTYGGETLAVTMTDAARGLEVILYYRVFDDAQAITRSSMIRNIGAQKVSLERAFSFSFDLPHNRYDLLTLYGAWARERMPERTPLHHGVASIDSKRGISSAILSPFLGVLDRETTETAGDAWGISLVYSSSYRLLAEGTQNGRTRVTGGISDYGFRTVLAPGESFSTPEVILAYSDEGIGGMSRALHDVMREHLIRPASVYAPRPLVINNWEATYFSFTYEKLFAIIDAAAGTGIDTFVLDDGWFGIRDNDRSGLGDWFINRTKLPEGLTPIIRHCHKRGLKFGLWFEPEMVNPDSDLYRAHPDWAIHSGNLTPTLSRHQYMLDLTRSDVRDYLVEAISKILSENEIDYVKWDCNRNMTEYYSDSLPAERQGEFAHQYALGLYDLCDRIVLGHPNIFFEGCSGGGGRFDPAMFAYFPQIWTSDDTDAGMRARIQYGTSIAFPASTMSCHVSACPNHQIGRVTPFSARADIAHLGATGYELDASVLPEEELGAIPAQTAAYRNMEHLMLKGDLYRLANPFTSSYFAFLFVAKDRSEAHLTLMRQMCETNSEGLVLKFQGLDPDALYRIEETGECYHGSTLMRVGIRPNVGTLRDFTTMTRHLIRVPEEENA